MALASTLYRSKDKLKWRDKEISDWLAEVGSSTSVRRAYLVLQTHDDGRSRQPVSIRKRTLHLFQFILQRTPKSMMSQMTECDGGNERSSPAFQGMEQIVGKFHQSCVAHE